jgi:hypothetical protein
MITVHVLHGETRICTQPMGCDMGKGKDLRPAYGHAKCKQDVPRDPKVMLKRKNRTTILPATRSSDPVPLVSSLAWRRARRGEGWREKAKTFQCCKRLIWLQLEGYTATGKAGHAPELLVGLHRRTFMLWAWQMASPLASEAM